MNSPVNSPVIVPVKSAWASKVNWIAGVTALAGTLTQLYPYVPPRYQSAMMIVILSIGGIATIVAKTFYTSSVSPASIPATAPLSKIIHTPPGTENEAIVYAPNLAQLKLKP